MQTSPVLTKTLAACVRRNNLFFKKFGVVATLSALCFLGLGVYAPMRPDEATARLVVLGMGGFIGVSGVGFWVWSERRCRYLMKLALNGPENIAKMEIVLVKKRNMHAWGLWLTDTRGRRVGTTVPSQDVAHEIVRALRAAGASPS